MSFATSVPLRLALGVILLMGIAGPAASRAEISDVVLEAVSEEVVDPVDLFVDSRGRVFVTQLRGQVVIVEDGEVLPEPLLDVSDRIPPFGHGLQSTVMHPGGRFVYLHRVERDTQHLLITRFSISDEDPDRVEADSEVVLIRIAKERFQHFGGRVQFGPDGYLYVSTGDDSDVAVGRDPECAAQSIDRLEGKILRLDVDQNVDTAPYYGIPPGNPFVGSGLPEIWARGLRNPWRFSFDSATGDLWIGDVGENDREEVNRQAVVSSGGENYGWKVMEGTSCFPDTRGCGASVPACDSPSLTLPVIEFVQGDGRCAMMGGLVYRGSLIPDLYGRYLYGDLCTGTIWAARQVAGGWESEELPVRLPTVVSFAEDAAGEVYLSAEGAFYRLVDPTAPAVPPCVADASHLCLNGGRFRVSVSWRTAQNQTGSGNAVTLGEDSGMFWFFSSNNPEVFVKLLDACFDPFNHFWVFAAGLTDVETSLEVVDTATGEVRRYERPLGESYEAVRDTSAFATCP